MQGKLHGADRENSTAHLSWKGHIFVCDLGKIRVYHDIKKKPIIIADGSH